MSAYIVSCHYRTITQYLTDQVQHVAVAYGKLLLAVTRPLWDIVRDLRLHSTKYVFCLLAERFTASGLTDPFVYRSAEFIRFLLTIIDSKDEEILELKTKASLPTGDLSAIVEERDNYKTVADKKTKECDRLKTQSNAKDKEQKKKNQTIRDLEEKIKELEKELGDIDDDESVEGEAGPAKDKKQRRRIPRAEKKVNKEKM